MITKRSQRPGEQFGGPEPGVLGDARCRGEVSRGEPADLMFRCSDGARAGGGCSVDVVFVNARLASVPVRGGMPFGDQPGRGHQPVGEPGAGTGAAGPGTRVTCKPVTSRASRIPHCAAV